MLRCPKVVDASRTLRQAGVPAVDDRTQAGHLVGMCKKHHDHSNGIISTATDHSEDEELSCQVKRQSTKNAQRHRLCHGSGGTAKHPN
jgi:hypothetical protein